ncbi:MAG: 50S ribosomal protein L18 [Eubacteriaceae bacterium]|nr:50S ribosomal protein L18 [Eubacteriaceae bacterium]
MIKKPVKNKIRKNRHKRMRFKLNGTEARPRLNVFRSNSYIYAQIVDDSKGITLVSASTLETDLRDKLTSTKNKEAAKLVGKLIGERALAKGIETVVFDRSGYLYHGKVKELAEGAREAGLKF